ncbi:hypothetical protein PFISCL1PPCAC_21399, partial [Pristionchus fissidentatus]
RLSTLCLHFGVRNAKYTVSGGGIQKPSFLQDVRIHPIVTCSARVTKKVNGQPIELSLHVHSEV